MADDAETPANDLALTADRLNGKMQDLTRSANAFAKIMASAFTQSITGAKSFEDALKAVGLRLSSMALQSALAPVLGSAALNIGKLLGTETRLSNVQPFASGGVIGTPSYFPLASGLGLAGEAGPEAILPLARGPDGQLGVAAGGGASAPRITVNITTPDAESFRRSEVFVTGQIARAVARGQRGL